MENYSFLGKTIALLQKPIVTLMKTIVENYSFCDRNYSFQPKTIVYFCKSQYRKENWLYMVGSFDAISMLHVTYGNDKHLKLKF